MATIKVACPKCGQKVSGDENFYGSVVECPICSSDIQFPGEKRDRPGLGQEVPLPIPPRDNAKSSPPSAKPTAEKETIEDLRLLSEERDRTDGTARAEDDASRSDRAIDITSQPRRESAAVSSQAPPHGSEGEVPSAFCGAVSLVSAVLGVVTCVFGAIFCPVAIIFGHLSQAKAKRSPVQPAPGQALGAAGLMIGYVWLVVTILILALAVLFKEPLVDFFASRAD